MRTHAIPWVSRAVLLAALVVLTLIGRKFIGDPVGAAADSNIVLNSPLAVTNMRASFGASRWAALSSCSSVSSLPAYARRGSPSWR
jgi:hypothetical protein